jgi:site-specific DNA-methyltransferase (adenine-specific)
MDKMILQNKKVDAIITDPPYGTTACSWDSIIPFEDMWNRLENIIIETGVIGLFASQPFTTTLIHSKLNYFKYCWYWKKSKPNGWQHSKNKPMTAIEEICIFSKAPMGHISQLGEKRMRYNPQGIVSIGNKKVTAVAHGNMMGARPNQIGKEYEAFTNFPHNVLEYPNVIGKQALHPTQKPVELCEYLILTYTNEGDTILDFTSGSGTTGVAAKKLKRKCIMIEKEEQYCEISKQRLIELDNE